jgi:hypothetical protein
VPLLELLLGALYVLLREFELLLGALYVPLLELLLGVLEELELLLGVE